MRTAFAGTYDRLGEPERSLFRLLGLLQTPYVTVRQACALLGCEVDHAERLLARLADCSLLKAQAGSLGELRYAIHELVRLYARECLDRELDTYGEPVPEPPAQAHVPAPSSSGNGAPAPGGVLGDQDAEERSFSLLMAPAECVNGSAARVLGP